MPDLNPDALLKMTPNRRWASRVHHAWHELKESRPADARIYTDYAPKVETPRKDGSGLVDREIQHGKGRVQVWRPGKPPKKSKGVLTEEYDGASWYGFSVTVDKSTSFDEIKAQVVGLLSRFKE